MMKSPPTMTGKERGCETCRASTMKHGARMIFREKLDDLATRNTAGSRTRRIGDLAA